MMPWWLNVSDYLKKKVCIYLLQRYLGNFIEEKLCLSQLELDLYSGTGTVRNVSLDVKALNELGESQNWPMEFVDGYVEELYVSVPLTTLLRDSTELQVTGLKLTVQPKQRQSAASIFDTMWSSMTSSMQLAKDCMKDEATTADNSQSFEGIETFAQTIDSILTRIKVKFVDTIIQIEHVPKDSLSGVAIQIHIDTIEYLDEAGTDPIPGEDASVPPYEANKGYLVATYTTKKLFIDGVTLSTVEFPSAARTFSRSVLVESNTGKSQSSQLWDSKDPVDSILEGDRDRCAFDESSQDHAQDDRRHQVLFGKLAGKQEIRIRLKQSEDVSGSKVSVEVNMGALVLFLSPRQVHVLVELVKGLASPDLEDTSNVPARQKCVEKPMTGSDFQRVEQDLQERVNPGNYLAGLGVIQGWSTADLENDGDDTFLPMTGRRISAMSQQSQMYDSAVSNISSSVDSVLSSSMMSSVSEANTNRSRRRADIESDPTAEIIHFQIRLASLAVVLLHEDLLTVAVPSDGDVLVPSSVVQMMQAADTFFNSLGAYNVSALNTSANNFDSSRDVFEKACQSNHLRLLAAPIHIEGQETTTQSAFALNGVMTAAKLELLECLHNDRACTASQQRKESAVQYVRIVSFESSELLPSMMLRTKPSLKLAFKHDERSRSVHSRKAHIPRTDLSFTLDTCTVDVDITIVDRISALLYGPPACIIAKPPTNHWSTTPLPMPLSESSAESRIDLAVKGADVTALLRFPIPDFRPKHDQNREPWWSRNVRPDFLTAHMLDVSFETSWFSNSTTRASIATAGERYVVQCRLVDVHYHEGSVMSRRPSVGPVLLGRVSAPDSERCTDKFDWPRIEIELAPEQNNDIFNFDKPMTDKESDPMTTSFYHGLRPAQGSTGPFTSKRVVHESDTPHNKPHQEEAEELVIPGDRAEMSQFIDTAIQESRMRLNLHLPVVTLDLPSKHTYEVLYNRINSDLLLWVPSAPVPTSYSASLAGVNSASAAAYYETALQSEAHNPIDLFTMCKSGTQYESDSGSDDDLSSSADDLATAQSLFYSLHESRHPRANKSSGPASLGGALTNKSGADATESTQNAIALQITIDKGIVRLVTPVRDNSNAVVPSQRAEFVLSVENGRVFSVTGYGGDLDLGYVCVQAGEARLCHCEMIPDSIPLLPLDTLSAANNKHLYETIYKSCDSVLVNCKGDGGERDMLTVAVKVQASHETHHVKTVKVALGINKATLRHRICLEPNTWITQIIDFFNVLDYPIAGYIAKDVLTELHLHVWDCALDYRPFYLPLRSVVTLGNFSMSSHLSAQSNTSTLRFIAEECALWLSMLTSKSRRNEPFTNKIDLVRDYICVVELGLFELSLRTNDKQSGINPHIDLRASNNIINIRTCSDSFKALIDLMIYFARDGDLSEDSTVPTDKDADCLNSDPVNSDVDDLAVAASPGKMSLADDGDQLIAVDQPQNISKLSTSQHEQVNELLGEAMEECMSISPKNEAIIEPSSSSFVPGARIFYFPDENQSSSSGALRSEIAKPNAQVTAELGDVTLFQRVSNTKSSDTDDEYCIIGVDAALGLLPKNGIPRIKWHTSSALHIIDNHFAVPLTKTDLLKPPKHFPTPTMRYNLCEMTLVWHLYGGHDFAKPQPEGEQKDVKSGSKRVNFEEPTVVSWQSPTNFTAATSGSDSGIVFTNNRSGEMLFPSGLMPDRASSQRKSDQSSWLARGGKGRNHNFLVEMQLSKVRFLHEVYPETSDKASRQVLVISEVEIRDRLKSSSFNKFLYQHVSESKPKQSHSHMVVVKATHIRPDQKLKAQECCLKVSLLPLRLNIDQDSLLFLINFFSELSGGDPLKPDNVAVNSKQNTPTHQPPVMTVCDENQEITAEEAHKIVDENLLMFLEEEKKYNEKACSTKSSTDDNDDSPPIYFRKILFAPEVPIRLDYQGKHVDMSRGSLSHFLMGLTQLQCSELRLKRLSNRHGILGFEKLVSYCIQEWLSEIKRNQLPSLLSGVGPINVIVQLVQGIFDLFWMPIEQYQKDGRIVRGLQRGANSFTTSTAMAALELTSRIIHLIQITAETAYDMMVPGPSVRRTGRSGRRSGRKAIGNHKRRPRPPQDMRSGVQMAYNVIKEGVEETAENIVRVASHEREQKGMSGAVGSFLRQIPPNMLVKPIILASEATNNLLDGMHNQLVPDAKRESNEKWKSDDS